MNHWGCILVQLQGLLCSRSANVSIGILDPNTTPPLKHLIWKKCNLFWLHISPCSSDANAFCLGAFSNNNIGLVLYFECRAVLSISFFGECHPDASHKHLFFFLVDEIMTGTRTGQVLYTLTMLKVFVDQASCVTLGKWCSHGMVLWNAKHMCTDILPQLGYGLGCSQQIYPMAYLYTRQSKAYMPFSIRSNALWQMIGKGCNNLVPPEVDWAGP